MMPIDSLVKSETYKRNTELILLRTRSSRKALKWLFVEPFKTAPQKQVLVFVCFDSVIVLLMEVMYISWIFTIQI